MPVKNVCPGPRVKPTQPIWNRGVKWLKEVYFLS